MLRADSYWGVYPDLEVERQIVGRLKIATSFSVLFSRYARIFSSGHRSELTLSGSGFLFIIRSSRY
jgi:hypothetical protein